MIVQTLNANPKSNSLSHSPSPNCALRNLTGFADNTVFVDLTQSQNRQHVYKSPIIAVNPGVLRGAKQAPKPWPRKVGLREETSGLRTLSWCPPLSFIQKARVFLLRRFSESCGALFLVLQKAQRQPRTAFRAVQSG